MDIHKPKPWHGLREFVKEIGTIVIGVSIALGAEQGVEAIHWSHKVDEAQIRLKRELRTLASYALERDLVDSCLDRRLSDLRTNLLGGSGRWTPLPPMVSPTVGSVAYFVPHRQWAQSVWKAVNSEGTATHLPKELQQQYGMLYEKMAQIADYDQVEFVDVGALNVLNFETEIPAAQRLQLVAQIEQERRRNSLVSLLARQNMAQIAKLGAQDQADALNWALVASNTYRACAKLALLPPGSPPPHKAIDPVAAGLLR